MAEVTLKNIQKVYDGSNFAVKDCNIEIKDKEFVVLVGPSGCGKTTTLRMIAGLEEITSGELTIDGRVVNNVSPKDRDIAMVFQNYALYPHMTVYENMAFGLKLRKFPKEEIKKRVEEAAKILGLEEYLNRKPKALSGGQRQRVAVGRAIVRKPKVFLFDEPLSNLDAKLRVQMRTEISRLHQRLGATMVYVTHDQTEAMTMGDKIVVMKDGVVNQIDTPLNLYNYPVNKFVAGFIGSPAMNFMSGTITGGQKIAFVSSGKSVTIPFPENSTLKAHTGKVVSLGIRPEDIYDESTKPDSENLVKIHTRLEVVEPMGNEIFLYFVLEGEQHTARVGARESVTAGSDINLYFDTEKLHFFDNETGKRIEI
ncbi:MAG: sn-glycerol-3-phosphate ABC transporter ATP-binding protein UgpC [Ignavibacteriales bacterium]|jgi:multiple sugar transport system ATP-binding protein|nr:sn-glycerol-3-phosphate ABC transporter ATP-binding protein UgpC [Ignavibacteriaceae bacterium]NLH61091.1 sn-glycerol-3-phosphate ABC transporter ATP-binding protein UgpC [Ignavibacteriales bacterium]HOJ17604.1 sn-glycerol-3-phosphate ABC transporter ATP-binding protein UgpC [Ignavibacteriaceae bacterium]HPO55952.1 sn-glycerol-3-phosphate ABC transporter ATP-binding protein UgpC [Ignavibacteriaceae bacterium]